MPTYKLYYFDGRGIAEVIRLLFNLSDQKFEDIRVPHEKWAEVKPTTPDGTLPYLEIDGKPFGQSLAISRYLAREFGYYGKTNLDQLQVDIIVDNIADFRAAGRKSMFEQDEAKKAEALKTLTDETTPAFLAKVEKMLKESKTGYLVGGSVTLADIAFFDIVDGLCLRFDSKTIVDPRPTVKAFMEKIRGLPKVKDYLANRKDTKF